jgi:hypothetical protein
MSLDMLSSMFFNPWILLALPAVLIPVIIHLLNRRRYEVVDWGAMQFLQMSEKTRRRVFIEELLLMLLRMALIALLIFALAGPFLQSSTLAKLGPKVNRDVVLVFDGSYSMGSTSPNGPTPHEAAKEWAKAFLHDLAPGDSVAVLQAKDVPVPVLNEPSHDIGRVYEAVDHLPAPAGSCDWRPALQSAFTILSHSQRAEREVIVLSDGQKYGWADRDSVFRWEVLASEWGLGQPRPRLWVVNVATERPADPPNWSLAPLESNRPVVPVGREVTFGTAMELHGQKAYTPPHRVRLEVDGKWVRDLGVPRTAELQNGKVPFSFAHRFVSPGSHLVSVILEPDPPRENWPEKYTPKDTVPGDNRQDFAIEVVQALPVLLVDGDSTLDPSKERGTDFLRDALAPALDTTPVVKARVVRINEFDPALLGAEAARGNAGPSGLRAGPAPLTEGPSGLRAGPAPLTEGPSGLRAGPAPLTEGPSGLRAGPAPLNEGIVRPRVLILHNVPSLTTAQQEAIAQFLADGGGVLVTLGGRVDADAYNASLYRSGKGWLPAKLEGQEGDVTRPEQGARPVPGGADHPALALFMDRPQGGEGPARFPQLGKALFPRWWKLSTPGKNSTGVPVALLRAAGDSTQYPFLVEWIDPNRAGRVLVSAVPLDNSWGANVVRLPAFVPLAHELVYYLAGARSAEYNLEPGQPIRYRLESPGPVEGFALETPLGESRFLSTDPAEQGTFLAHVDRQPQGAVLRIEGVKETGVYRLRTPEGATIYYAVRPRGHEESDLTPCDDKDREAVAKIVPEIKYQNEREKLAETWVSESHRQELWWVLMLALVGFLCCELWLTRRIVKGR